MCLKNKVFLLSESFGAPWYVAEPQPIFAKQKYEKDDATKMILDIFYVHCLKRSIKIFACCLKSVTVSAPHKQEALPHVGEIGPQ